MKKKKKGLSHFLYLAVKSIWTKRGHIWIHVLLTTDNGAQKK